MNIYLFHFSYKYCLFTWLSAIDLIQLINLNSRDIVKFIPTSIIPIKWNDQPKFIGKLRENSFLNKFRLPSFKGRIIPQINWNFKYKATHNKMKIGNYLFLSKSFFYPFVCLKSRSPLRNQFPTSHRKRVNSSS
jgi:hypothetical protein